MSKLYPIGIQNFESLRKDGYLYVDKTRLIYQLVKTGRYYFLSRPRRFGKSLLISTLEAYYQGKKELFEGLAIEQLEKDWIKHPILHLDLNIEKYDTPESLDHILNDNLEHWESLYGTRPSEVSFSLRFAGIIQRAYEQTGQRVVILVDEYDKPMLQAIGNEELQKYFRNTLKPFYGVLKSKDGCIKLGFLTGVTKFGKISIFSDLNNLIDISMDEQYVELCGITEKEIHDNMEEDLYILADKQKMTYEEVCTELKECYDGYHFVEDSIGIYEETDADVLNSIDSTSRNPIPVIYQSGYLTIKGFDNRFGIYRLGFPNREVEEGFIKYLLPFYTNIDVIESPFQIRQFVDEVEHGDCNAFFRRLQSFFADTPYELIRDLELHYQNVLFIVFKLIGFYVKAEYHTSQGRIDLVLQTNHYVYIMEFKLEGTAEEALRQINDKHYAQAFASDKRTIFKIGVNFSNETRNIEKWIVE